MSLAIVFLRQEQLPFPTQGLLLGWTPKALPAYNRKTNATIAKVSQRNGPLTRRISDVLGRKEISGGFLDSSGTGTMIMGGGGPTWRCLGAIYEKVPVLGAAYRC